MADIQITRDLTTIIESFNELKKEMTDTKQELNSVNRALRLDPTSTELLAEKSRILGEQLEQNRQKSELLGEAIAELNRIKAEQGELDKTQTSQLARLTKEYNDAQNQIIGLTGATREQTEVTKETQSSTNDFSKSMTEFRSNLMAVNQAVGGVIDVYEMFGGDSDSATGKVLKQTQNLIQTTTKLASAGKLLQTTNKGVAASFATLAVGIGAAFLAYQATDKLMNSFSGTAKKVAGAIAIVTAAVGALAVAIMIKNSVLSWGTATAALLAAAAVGAAGVKALLPSGDSIPTSSVSSAATSIEVPTTTVTQKRELTVYLDVHSSGDTPISTENSRRIASSLAEQINFELGELQ